MADNTYYVEPYEMLNRGRQPLPPVPTVSSKVGSPSHTVVHTKSSSVPLCRMFLMILTSFIIGGLVGGAISYLWASREGSEESCSKIAFPTTMSQCSCPICQTSETTLTSGCPKCQTCETTSGCPKCPTCENAPACPTCQTCQTEPEWQLVFKAVSGIANRQETDQLLLDPYKVWEREAPYNEHVSRAKQLDTSFRGHYKSSFALNWQRRNIREVKVGLFDAAGNELINLIFDAVGSNNMNWFSKDRLLSSPWIDLYCEPQNYFSVIGYHNRSLRRWYINRNYGGCPADRGWLAVVGQSIGVCEWENVGNRYYKPLFLFSKGNANTNWNTEQNVGEADIFAIFVKTY